MYHHTPTINHEQLDIADNRVTYSITPNGRYFTSPYVSGYITYNKLTDTYTLNGRLTKYSTIEYLSSSPIGRNQSLEGSGLPFHNYQIAYDNTPNQGTISPSSDGSFTIKLKHPNSYYINLGKVLLKPHIHLSLTSLNTIVTLVIDNNLPYRSLTSLPNTYERSIGR